MTKRKDEIQAEPLYKWLPAHVHQFKCAECGETK